MYFETIDSESIISASFERFVLSKPLCSDAGREATMQSVRPRAEALA